MSLPWWLRPWREVRELRHAADGYVQRIDDLCATASRDIATIAEQEQLIWSMRGQLAVAVTDARVSGAAFSTVAPEHVVVFIPRGDGLGKRIQASRDIEVTAFAITEPDNPPPRWKLGVIMEQMLTIDQPTYAQCLSRLAEIWANRDRNERNEHPAAALTGPDGHVVTRGSVTLPWVCRCAIGRDHTYTG
jgi:hypothetical protein